MRKIIYILILCSITSCGIRKKAIVIPKEEFRGVWIATVANIDWPKNGNDDIQKQQQDFLEILDFYKALNFNAVVVQIRTAGDAFYPSKLAPWSRFLTGKEGKAPKKNYNPLQWMITQAHNKGFEFHAWLNPYRATTDLDTNVLAKNHDFYLHKDWMIKYGKKYYYNPALPEVQQHLTKVIEEVIINYDVDAIHFDDYFYPYKIKNEVFNDATSFKKYNSHQLSLDDWRRSNVDSLVKNIYKTIKRTKPWVQFGISPFGIWRNKTVDSNGSDTQAGQTTYDDLYADPMSWCKNGWIDYLVPQVYWSLKHPKVSHKKIANWWSKNTLNTNLYIGNGAYKIRLDADRAWNKKNEIPKQLLLARSTKTIKGNVFFSAKSFMDKGKKNVVSILKNKFYDNPAIVPRLKTKEVNYVPVIKIAIINTSNSFVTFKMTVANGNFNKLLVYNKNKKQLLSQVYIINNTAIVKLKKEDVAHKKITVRFLDKFGNKSNYLIINTDNF